MRILLVAAALAMTVTACGFPKAGAVPPPVAANDVTAAQTNWADASEGELRAGHDQFVAKCNACHAYPDVRAVAAEKWPAVMDRMGKRAQLDASASQAVLRFVLVARER